MMDAFRRPTEWLAGFAWNRQLPAGARVFDLAELGYALPGIVAAWPVGRAAMGPALTASLFRVDGLLGSQAFFKILVLS